MKHLALLWIPTLAIVAAAGVTAMADEMQFRTDRGEPDTRTIVTFDAESRTGGSTEDPALIVWKNCRSTVNHVQIRSGPAEHDGAWTIVLNPALGVHTERRFLGCIRDLNVDGITGEVIHAQRLSGGVPAAIGEVHS
ncbi:hypothetical protein ACWF9G_27450 [Nocardia sp. NPDC055029]